jgi:superfamily I DNA/RNA helicase
MQVWPRFAIEEERGLLRVAMTRAKDQLHLMALLQWSFNHGQRRFGDRIA